MRPPEDDDVVVVDASAATAAASDAAPPAGSDGRFHWRSLVTLHAHRDTQRHTDGQLSESGGGHCTEGRTYRLT